MAADIRTIHSEHRDACGARRPRVAVELAAAAGGSTAKRIVRILPERGIVGAAHDIPGMRVQDRWHGQAGSRN